jgi:DNA-binding response OmpR family regulator
MQKLVFGALEIDRAAHRAVLGGVALDLTLREYTLLMHLAHHAGRIVTRTDLLAQVWETGFDSGSNVVDVQISRLRDKLGAHSFMIETVRGFGYRLRAEPSS